MGAPLPAPPLLPARPPTEPPAPEPWRQRVPRLLIKFLAVYTAIVASFIIVVVLVGSHNPTDRAIILMAAGLIVIWVLLGGYASLRFRDPIRACVLRLAPRWEWKFLVFAAALALLEEGVTTTMTNLAPVFGSQIGVAYITASNNYLIVIAFSSVGPVIVPEIVGWVILLRRFDFSANEVFLIYGLLGTTMEATLNPFELLAGFWFFVYGLMVYLPAYSLPRTRGAALPRWYHYLLAYFLPLACALPVVGLDLWFARDLGVHLWGG